MKQTGLFPIIILLFFTFLNISSLKASTNIPENFQEVTAFDESEIYNAFSEIEEQVTYIWQNENITYSQLAEAGFSTINISNASSTSGSYEQFRFDSQTSFWMGCLFGGLGVLAVVLVNEGDQAALNNSLWGCATSSIIGVLSVVGVYAFMFSYLGYYM